jgi:hypothetical protein
MARRVDVKADARLALVAVALALLLAPYAVAWHRSRSGLPG